MFGGIFLVAFVLFVWDLRVCWFFCLVLVLVLVFDEATMLN